MRNKYKFRVRNAVVKRKIIEKYDIKFPPYRYSEDVYFFLLYLAVSHKIYVSDLIGFTYNIVGSSLVLKGDSQVKINETIKSYELLFERLRELGKENELDIVKQHCLPGSILSYIDSAPRRYKLKYLLDNIDIILPYILLGRCPEGFCDWAYLFLLKASPFRAGRRSGHVHRCNHTSKVVVAQNLWIE